MLALESSVLERLSLSFNALRAALFYAGLEAMPLACQQRG